MRLLTPRRVLGVAVALVAWFVLVAPFATAQTTLVPYEQQVLDLVNQQRAANGLQPLTIDTRLVDAARAHNAKMIQTGEFSHQVTGELPMCAQGANNDRFDAVGYPWTTCGENIAAGQKTPADVMTAWMGSSGHRANILNPSFKNIGIGYTTGGGYGSYWTQDFGAASGGSVPTPTRTPTSQPTATPTPVPAIAAKSSFIWRNVATGQNTVWTMNGGTVVSYPALPSVPDLNWKIEALGDLNGDGKADLVWRNTSTGQMTAWLMSADNQPSYAALPTNTDANWKLLGAGDLNADGKADLIWRNASNGQNVAWLMNGASVTSYAYLPILADLNWKVAAIGDLNADRKADLIWRNVSNGQTVAWLMDGANLASYNWLSTVADLNWKVVASGDLNADGKTDLIWRNASNGQTVAWLMNGASVSSYPSLPTVADTHWRVVAGVDLDADGKTDLVWRNASNGQMTAWLMNGSTVTSYPSLPTVADLNWKVISPAALLTAVNEPSMGLTKAQTEPGLQPKSSPTTPDPAKDGMTVQPAPVDAPPMWSAPTPSEQVPMWTAPELPGKSH